MAEEDAEKGKDDCEPTNSDSNSSLIQKVFKKRECVKFVQSPSEVDRCGCGRQKNDHKFAADGVGRGPWSISHHTQESPTDSFGVIEFQGGPHPHKTPFARVTFDANPEDVFRLLENHWCLGRPNLIISVHGSVENFDLPPKVSRSFFKGLPQAARTTGAWIITSGLHSGVVKYVASALTGRSICRGKRKYVSIGIAPWGMLKNREDFLVQSGETSPAGTEGAVVTYHSRAHHPSSRYGVLDDSHTHILLADDGTTHRYGSDIVLRRRLEEYIFQQALPGASNTKNVPIVCVILNGGILTLQTVLDYITTEPPVPVIVVEGSGGIADYLAVVERYNENDRPLSLRFKMQLLAKIQTDFKLSKIESENVYNMLMLCAREKEKLCIFRLEVVGQQDFDYAILTGLLKAQRSSPVDQLGLTLTWNRPDIARGHIFTSGRTWDQTTLQKFMMEALLFDRVNFAELLIANGLSIDAFVTVERLEKLYNSTVGPMNTLSAVMPDVVARARKPNYQYKLADVGLLYQNLMGNVYESPYYIAGKCSPLPYNDLFLWAILSKRHSMALLMWESSKEALPKALVAIRLCRALSKEAAEDCYGEEMCFAFDKCADHFERLSLNLLERCYRRDDDLAIQTLTRELSNWGNETCLSLAVRAAHQEFLAHTCCQLLLNDLWQGGLKLHKFTTSLVLLGIVFPPMLLALDYKTHEELLLQAQRGDQQEEAKQRPQEEALAGRKIPSVVTRSTATPPSGSELSIGKKIVEFYAAPITTFWFWTISYFIFLVIYTWFVLLEIPPRPSVQEMFVITYAGVYALDLLRVLITNGPNRFIRKLGTFGQRRWNLTLTLAIIMLFVAVGLRFFPKYRVDARIIYVCNIIFWYARLFDIMRVNNQLGPYIVMLGKMLTSFMYFATILTVMVVSFGVAIQSLSHHGTAVWTRSSLRDIMYRPYFMLYGEVFPDRIDECGDQRNDTTTTERVTSTTKDDILEAMNATADYHDTPTRGQQWQDSKCAVGHWVSPILLAIYLLATNTLLLNVLIATFSHIFTEVNAVSLIIWKFYRYDQVIEYEQKPFLPPPLTIIGHVYMIFKFLFRKVCRRGSRLAFDHALKLVCTDKETELLLEFEATSLKDMNQRKGDEEYSSLSGFAARADDRSELVSMKIDDVQSKNALHRIAIENLEQRIASIERFLSIKDQ